MNGRPARVTDIASLLADSENIGDVCLMLCAGRRAFAYYAPRGSSARAVRSKLMIDGTMNTRRQRKYCIISRSRGSHCDWIHEIDERIGNDDFRDIVRRDSALPRFSPFPVNRRSSLNDSRAIKKKYDCYFSNYFPSSQKQKKLARNIFHEIIFSENLFVKLESRLFIILCSIFFFFLRMPYALLATSISGTVSGRHESWEFDSGARDLSPEPHSLQKLVEAAAGGTGNMLDLANKVSVTDDLSLTKRLSISSALIAFLTALDSFRVSRASRSRVDRSANICLTVMNS